MKPFLSYWPLLAALAIVWWLMRRPAANPAEAPKAFANPGGTATPEELAYTDYLTNWVDTTPLDKFDNKPVAFVEWLSGTR